MNRILEMSRYLIIVAVFFSLLASIAAFAWGGARTVTAIINVIASSGEDPLAAVSFIQLMDTFLIAIGLFIFAIGLYELFIHDVALPSWLTIHSLHDLKSRLSSVIILVMTVAFLEHLVEWKDPKGTLYFGIAVAVVSAVLIGFSRLGDKD